VVHHCNILGTEAPLVLNRKARGVPNCNTLAARHTASALVPKPDPSIVIPSGNKNLWNRCLVVRLDFCQKVPIIEHGNPFSMTSPVVRTEVPPLPFCTSSWSISNSFWDSSSFATSSGITLAAHFSAIPRCCERSASMRGPIFLSCVSPDFF